VPRSVVPIVLEPIVASFSRAYPEVQVEIVASEELVDLAANGFDAGVRMGQFIAPDMVTVRLSQPFQLAVVSSPAYLANRSDAVWSAGNTGTTSSLGQGYTAYGRTYTLGLSYRF
jgi:DNA-binding transcriptional LysR family regulator